MEEEQSLCSTEVLEINEEEEEYYDVQSSLKHVTSNPSSENCAGGFARASKANLEDGLKGAHGDGSDGALIKHSRGLEARKSSGIAIEDSLKGKHRPGSAQHAAPPPLLPSQYPKCPEPLKWNKGVCSVSLGLSNTQWICNMLAVDYPLTQSVPIQLEVYSDGSLVSQNVLMLNKCGNGAQVTASRWIRDTLKLRKKVELLELVYLNSQTVVAHGPYKGQTVHRFQIKKVSDAVAETVADSAENEMELSSDEEQEEEGGGPSDAALQLKSPQPILINVGIYSNCSGTTHLSPDITEWLAGVVKVPYPLEDSLCLQLEAYDGNKLIGEKSVILSKNYNGSYLGGHAWLIEMLKLRGGDNGINLTYLGRKKVVHYFQGWRPEKRLAYRFKVEKATSHSPNVSSSTLQKRNRASNNSAAVKKSAPSAVKRRSILLNSADGKDARASSPAGSTQDTSNTYQQDAQHRSAAPTAASSAKKQRYGGNGGAVPPPAPPIAEGLAVLGDSGAATRTQEVTCGFETILVKF